MSSAAGEAPAGVVEAEGVCSGDGAPVSRGSSWSECAGEGGMEGGGSPCGVATELAASKLLMELRLECSCPSRSSHVRKLR
eukprot:scaffold137908_cov139-Phaeocystis_antarctica.AAC.1